MLILNSRPVSVRKIIEYPAGTLFRNFICRTFFNIPNYRRQISFQIFSEFKRINKLQFSLKSSENF